MWLQVVGWLACVVYSTIPAFWLMIHPFAGRWRARRGSPYLILLPAWMTMWGIVALVTWSWRQVSCYSTGWAWVPAGFLFAGGFYLYAKSGKSFSAQQLGGLPEVLGEVHGGNRDQRLVTDGIRARVRHPVYLAHLCEMLAWSVGTGLAVCWGLTALAIITGAAMIRLEDAELEQRFGEDFVLYRRDVPAVLPKMSRLSFSVISVIVICLLASIPGFLWFAAQRRAQPMIFQHGTPEVSGGRAFAIMNPFRNRDSEHTAERLIRGLRTSQCERIVQDFTADERICPVMRENRVADLIWRSDTDSARVLVYDLPDVQVRMWVSFSRDESGFGVARLSMIR